MVSHLAIATDGLWSSDGTINNYILPLKGIISEPDIKGYIVQSNLIGKINVTILKGVISE